MILDKYEEAALAGEHGDIMQMAYRILVAMGEAADAPRLVPVEWVHLSGVNYNTIGDAGEEFLRSIRGRARVRVRTTLNPMGYDADHAEDVSFEFAQKQESIRKSYEMMGVITSFSCIPYDIFEMPGPGAQVALAESNAAIHANTFDNLRTNKESAFSALASALTGKSPYTSLRDDDNTAPPDAVMRMDVENPTELDWGLLGYAAGQMAENRARICGAPPRDRRSCKALCGGAGTSGTCAKLDFGGTADGPVASFDDTQARRMREELSTAEKGQQIVLGSPQLGMDEVRDLVYRMAGRRFKKECVVFCPRQVKERAASLGYVKALEGAGCRILADCCACLTPLVSGSDTDSVVTNSIKGAYYMSRHNDVGVCLKPLGDIIRDETV